MKTYRKPDPDAPDMSVERRQTKLQANTEATERWMRRLFRAATELKKLSEQRKRLLYPKGKKLKYRELSEIGHTMIGGNEFNDEIPL